MYRILASGLFAAGLLAPAAHADAPPIAAFARSENIAGAAISPDGHYLAQITSEQGIRVAMVKDLTVAHSMFQTVMSSATDNHFFITWCKWATNRRLVCALRGSVHNLDVVYTVTRLAAVDADGKHLMVLVQGDVGSDPSGQFQDAVVDWSPGKPDTVLIATNADVRSAVERSRDEATSSLSMGTTGTYYPGLFELNVVTGKMQKQMEPHPPLRIFRSDRRGHARLGWGFVRGTDRIEIEARNVETGEWRSVLTYKSFTTDPILRPIAICNDNPDCAYALGDQGRACGTVEGRS